MRRLGHPDLQLALIEVLVAIGATLSTSERVDFFDDLLAAHHGTTDTAVRAAFKAIATLRWIDEQSDGAEERPAEGSS
jgi:hypothetical protein